jgi:hypothetical protein
MLVEDLLRRLETVRRTERRVVRLTVAARATAALILGLLAYFLLDLGCEPSLAGRWAAAAALLGLAGWVCLRGIWRAGRRAWDEDEVALRWEDRHPELRGRLIATVQLCRAKHEGRYAASEELLQALNTETLRIAAPLDLLAIVPRDLLRKSLRAAGALLCVQALCFFFLPAHFEALFLRLVRAEQPYPTRARILHFAVPPYVARGDELPVTVSLDPDHEIPLAPGAVTFRDAASRADTVVDLVFSPETPALRKASLNQALEEVQVRVQCGDARSEWRTVQVLARPEVRASTVRYHLPSYLHEPDPAPVRLGPLEALQGSTVDLEFEATQPLIEAQLIQK